MKKTRVNAGDVFEAKEKGRGMYLVLLPETTTYACRCLVLIEDKFAPSEPAGVVATINRDWLTRECWRLS